MGQTPLVIAETRETANLRANPLFETLTLTICGIFESEFWSETMRPVAETITAEMLKRFQITPKNQP